MAHYNVSGIPGDAANFLVDAETIDSDEALNAELGNVPPGTLAHTAGYGTLVEKDLDGSWVDLNGGSRGDAEDEA